MTSGDVSVTETNVQELILAADMLELSDVVEICSAFLKQQLEPSNAIGIYRFVFDCQLPQLVYGLVLSKANVLLNQL